MVSMKKLIFSCIGLLFIIMALIGLERGAAFGLSRFSHDVALSASPIKFYFHIAIQLSLGATSILYAFNILKDN